MNREELYSTMFTRRSERTFEHVQLNQDIVAEVQGAMKEVEPLIEGVRTELRFYANGEVRAYSPFSIAAYTEPTRAGSIAAGYALEQLDLWLWANDYGSCWIGAAKAPETVPGLAYAGAICFGIPKDEPRTSEKQFHRKPLSRITDIVSPGPVLEAARLAPSALNRQPWFFSGTHESMKLLTRKMLLADKLTLLDTGVALLFIELAAQHNELLPNITLAPDGAFDGRKVLQAEIQFSKAQSQ